MPFPRDQLVAFLIAVSFAAGLNLYATIATLGLLARMGLVVLPGELGALAAWWVIALSTALFLVEFVADKIPVFDLVWNALHTFVRVPAGALLSYAATSSLGPSWQLAAAAIGGTMALAAHGGKTAARAAVTSSPEPFTNFALSSAEDVFAIGVTWLTTRHPIAAAGIVLAIVATLALFVQWIVRAMREMFNRPTAARVP